MNLNLLFRHERQEAIASILDDLERDLGSVVEESGNRQRRVNHWKLLQMCQHQTLAGDNNASPESATIAAFKHQLHHTRSPAGLLDRGGNVHGFPQRELLCIQFLQDTAVDPTHIVDFVVIGVPQSERQLPPGLSDLNHPVLFRSDEQSKVAWVLLVFILLVIRRPVITRKDLDALQQNLIHHSLFACREAHSDIDPITRSQHSGMRVYVGGGKCKDPHAPRDLRRDAIRTLFTQLGLADHITGNHRFRHRSFLVFLQRLDEIVAHGLQVRYRNVLQLHVLLGQSMAGANVLECDQSLATTRLRHRLSRRGWRTLPLQLRVQQILDPPLDDLVADPLPHLDRPLCLEQAGLHLHQLRPQQALPGSERLLDHLSQLGLLRIVG